MADAVGERTTIREKNLVKSAGVRVDLVSDHVRSPIATQKNSFFKVAQITNAKLTRSRCSNPTFLLLGSFFYSHPEASRKESTGPENNIKKLIHWKKYKGKLSYRPVNRSVSHIWTLVLDAPDFCTSNNSYIKII